MKFVIEIDDREIAEIRANGVRNAELINSIRSALQSERGYWTPNSWKRKFFKALAEGSLELVQ